MESIKTIEWAAGRVRIIDQTRLPHQRVYLDIRTPQEMVAAIQAMRIRGAPALGVAGAYGLALGGLGIRAGSRAQFLAQLRPIAEELCAARPTAVNLSWGVQRLLAKAEASEYPQVEKLQQLLVAEAQRVQQEDLEANRRLGAHGARLIPQEATVLTHCNAGALATAGYGTALGVLRAAKEAGKALKVYVDETRPLLQGARLTAWELVEEGIPATLIVDSMAGHFLRTGGIQCVVVGADRIAANGDVANKIGTYSVAVLAKENGVPFYVAAPTSTIDLSLPSGDQIPIEERSPSEVTHIGEVPLAPVGVSVANPAFDVTPARYVSAIITEGGIVYPPYEEGLRRICGR
ncbi:MAG: S-methyl-5-thioribose-1-phosphate isomerase [Chloroflexi bacterium]|nr:S-methyl-5-thioribose-1-phosphate isomerase [Chloroflexota bacterium]